MLEIVKDWIPLIIGVVTFLGGILAWYTGAVEKKYAAQRDFAHLKNNQLNISNNIAGLLKEQDRRFDQLDKNDLEMKNLLMNVFMSNISDAVSANMRKHNER